MSIEEKVKGVFKNVLDIKPEEIKLAEKLDQSLGIDSTEMVEIAVAIKKEFGLDMASSDIKKTQSLNEIIEFLKSNGAN
ncbi:MAG: phosphopantetheine-binding protein [Candidatus Omnitrophota bacterium]